jgi:hypothetical protein
MIIQGRKGCLCLFYRDLLIAGFPLGNNSYEDYKTQSHNLILDSLRKNKSIKEQIQLYKIFCETIYEKKIKKEKISGYDLQVFSSCLLSLIKFNQLEEEDFIFIAPRKKKRGKKFNQNLFI